MFHPYSVTEQAYPFVGLAEGVFYIHSWTEEGLVFDALSWTS